MKNRQIGAMTTVASLNVDPNYVFITDTAEVRSIKIDHPNAAEYDSFFVKAGDGEYLEVWGMCGIVPRLSKLISRIA